MKPRAVVQGRQFDDDDEGIKAVIELSRMASKPDGFSVFHTADGFDSVVSIVFTAYVLASPGWDARRLDKGRDIMKQTIIGLFLAVLSYVIVSGVIALYVQVAGSDGAAAAQWKGSLSNEGDFNVDDLLDFEAGAVSAFVKKISDIMGLSESQTQVFLGIFAVAVRCDCGLRLIALCCFTAVFSPAATFNLAVGMLSSLTISTVISSWWMSMP